jgi:hypothetical protein
MHNTGAAAVVAVAVVMVVAAVVVTSAAAVVAAILAAAFPVVVVQASLAVQAVVFQAAAGLHFRLHVQAVSAKDRALAVHARQHKVIPVLTVAGPA